MIVKCNNGIEIKIEESELYVKVIVGDTTWYWHIVGYLTKHGSIRLACCHSD